MKVCPQDPCSERSKASRKPGRVSLPPRVHTKAQGLITWLLLWSFMPIWMSPRGLGKQNTTPWQGQLNNSQDPGVVPASIPQLKWGSSCQGKVNGCWEAKITKCPLHVGDIIMWHLESKCLEQSGWMSCQEQEIAVHTPSSQRDCLSSLWQSSLCRFQLLLEQTF